LVADIKRYMEDPTKVASIISVSPAPPGAPIGDMPQDWLARPRY